MPSRATAVVAARGDGADLLPEVPAGIEAGGSIPIIAPGQSASAEFDLEMPSGLAACGPDPTADEHWLRPIEY